MAWRQRTSVAAPRLAVVFCLKWRSASLAYRAYMDPLDHNGPLLSWCVRRITPRLAGGALYVMCHEPAEEAELTALLGESARIVRTSAATRQRSFCEISAAATATHVAFVAEGFSLTPVDLLTRVCAHHVASSNVYTPVVGFPAGTTPEIYSSEFLATLSSLPEAMRTSEPSALALGLAARRGLSAKLWPVRAVPFDAAAAYGVRPDDLPERILIRRPRDVVLARRVVEAERTDTSPLGGLRAWRRCAIDMRRQRREELRASMEAILPRRARAELVEPRRVLIVSNQSAFAGAEASLCQMLAHIDRTRFAVTALVGQEGVFSERLRQVGGTVVSPRHGFGGEFGDEDAAYLFATYLQVRPDLIHFNSPSGLPSLYCASLLQVPIVMHCRQPAPDPQREFLRAADAIIAVSQYIKRQVLKFEVDADRVRVIYNGVDADTFAPGCISRAAARDKLQLPTNAQVVLNIARFDPYKRHDLFLRAVALAKQRMPELHVVLNGETSGEGEVHDRVREHIRAHRMQEWVSIVPFVSDIRELHAAADVLVLCSEGEPLGRCVLEAMAMANPVIVNDTGGNHEVIRHGETGFVVPHNHAGRLADAIVQAVGDEALAKRLGDAARATVITTLTNRNTATRVMDLYDELLSSASARAARAMTAAISRR